MNKFITYASIQHTQPISMILNKYIAYLVFVCIALFIASTAYSSSAHAAPVVGFNAGNVIDDLVFTNSSSMSPGQIQSFLNSKVPTCDTWGTQTSEFGGGTRAQWGTNRGTPPPYVCLKDYTEGGKSASQIIYDVAQEFQINPQVLIVLLQKEQGLITDTWPLPVQYRTATGYGCPDTAACDSQYYGLTNQLRWSGRMFRAIINNSPTWYTPYVLGNNFIQWSPNSACGGSTVNIQNRSTQALYNYTPYQPNQSALNAGYGMGDSCGAYGNRNFYLYFTDWFGSVRSNDTLNPHPDGTLVDIDGSVYVIGNGSLHHITNGAVFESNNYRWQDVKKATSGDKSLSKSWSLDFINQGILYTGDNSGIYTTIYENNKWVKQQVSYASFLNLGYRWNQVRTVQKNEMPTSTSQSILTSSQHPNGTLIKNNNGVFLIDHGTKRYISAAVFHSHRWSWDNILSESNEDKQLPLGADVLMREGTIINDGTGLYVIKVPASGSEIKNPIGPWECYANVFKYNLEEIVPTSRTGTSLMQTGPRITC
jgi:hypothetical protein